MGLPYLRKASRSQNTEYSKRKESKIKEEEVVHDPIALFSQLGWAIISGNVLGIVLQLCLHLI